MKLLTALLLFLAEKGGKEPKTFYLLAFLMSHHYPFNVPYQKGAFHTSEYFNSIYKAENILSQLKKISMIHLMTLQWYS